LAGFTEGSWTYMIRRVLVRVARLSVDRTRLGMRSSRSLSVSHVRCVAHRNWFTACSLFTL